jgi:uncharacterized OB-fold protein
MDQARMSEHAWTKAILYGVEMAHCPKCGSVLFPNGKIKVGSLAPCEQSPSPPISGTRRVENDGVIIEGPPS